MHFIDQKSLNIREIFHFVKFSNFSHIPSISLPKINIQIRFANREMRKYKVEIKKILIYFPKFGIRLTK